MSFWEKAWPDTWPEVIVYTIILIILLNVVDEALGWHLNDAVWTTVKDVGTWAAGVFRDIRGVI